MGISDITGKTKWKITWRSASADTAETTGGKTEQYFLCDLQEVQWNRKRETGIFLRQLQTGSITGIEEKVFCTSIGEYHCGQKDICSCIRGSEHVTSEQPYPGKKIVTSKLCSFQITQNNWCADNKSVLFSSSG